MMRLLSKNMQFLKNLLRQKLNSFAFISAHNCNFAPSNNMKLSRKIELQTKKSISALLLQNKCIPSPAASHLEIKSIFPKPVNIMTAAFCLEKRQEDK